MSASKRKAKGKRMPSKPSKVVFEFFAERKNGPDLIYELAQMVPISMKSWGDVGAPVLVLDGRREQVLEVRLRLLRKYPGAVVRIFETPVNAHALWMFADESDFVASSDGFTFVIPGDPREPPKSKSTRRMSRVRPAASASSPRSSK